MLTEGTLTTGVTVILGTCSGPKRTEDGSCGVPGTYGPDCVYCTADDPPGGLVAVEATSPAVTGMATAVVHNANGVHGQDFGPATISGASFSCSALASGSTAGAGLAQAFAFVHQDTVGDGLFTVQFFAGNASYCLGDCDGNGQVSVDELLTLVNIALGSPGLCPNGVPTGATVDIALITQAVHNALNGCA